MNITEQFFLPVVKESGIYQTKFVDFLIYRSCKLH
jgi:hypothetical protein